MCFLNAEVATYWHYIIQVELQECERGGWGVIRDLFPLDYGRVSLYILLCKVYTCFNDGSRRLLGVSWTPPVCQNFLHKPNNKLCGLSANEKQILRHRTNLKTICAFVQYF